MMDEAQVYGLYLNNRSESCGYYSGEADNEGLMAVYNAGFEAGKIAASND